MDGRMAGARGLYGYRLARRESVSRAETQTRREGDTVSVRGGGVALAHCEIAWWAMEGAENTLAACERVCWLVESTATLRNSMMSTGGWREPSSLPAREYAFSWRGQAHGETERKRDFPRGYMFRVPHARTRREGNRVKTITFEFKLLWGATSYHYVKFSLFEIIQCARNGARKLWEPDNFNEVCAR
jgi:hypothetical protein